MIEFVKNKGRDSYYAHAKDPSIEYGILVKDDDSEWYFISGFDNVRIYAENMEVILNKIKELNKEKK